MGRRHKPHLRCADCRLHRSVCICGLLPRIETRTRVVLVVHQLELAKPTNTGLLAARCLPNSAVTYRGRMSEDPADPSTPDPLLAAAAATVEAGTQPLMLYPHPSATPLESWARNG